MGDWLAAIGVAAAAALLLTALVALLSRAMARRWRRRVRRRRSPRYPVVLAHGVCGFDALTVAGVRHEYFRGLAQRLEDEGAKVIAVRLPPTASIAARAERLASAVRALPAARVNIIAHSMGGLDSRYAISRLGLAKHVASLTTIGTPHHGTPLADVGTNVGDRLGLRRMCGALSFDIDAFYDLTTARMHDFNRQVRNAWRVSYASYVAVCRCVGQVNPLLLPSYYYLSRCSGANDGLVPASSQEWGRVLGQVEADHWAQVGWGRGFDATELYVGLVRELAASGF